MPRYRDIIARHQPMTARAVSGVRATGGAGKDSTGRALYTGAWSYNGTAVYGPGGRITYDGEATYDGQNSYYIPE